LDIIPFLVKTFTSKQSFHSFLSYYLWTKGKKANWKYLTIGAKPKPKPIIINRVYQPM
jgi:hypothetical protein